MVHFFSLRNLEKPKYTQIVCLCVCVCITIDVRNLATTGRLLCVVLHFVVTLVRF